MRYKLILIVVLYLTSSISVFTQNLVLQENPEKLKTIKDEVSDGKALLLFESDLDIEFESSMEFLQLPVKHENIYKLLLNEKTCVITVKNIQTASQAVLQFGQISSSENSRPSLKNQEIKYFVVKQVTPLEYFNITDKNISNGVAIDNQMLYEKEALIIFNVDPIDLKLEFSSTTKITEIKEEQGRYRLYLQPVEQTVTIKNPHVDETYIVFKDLLVKEVRYYYIQLPYKFRTIETQSTDKSLITGSYYIETKPPGATIEMIGNPYFNQLQFKTPYLIKELETGTKIVSLKLYDYEPIQDTIYIGKGKANKSEYNLIPKFSFLTFNIDPAPPVSKIFIDGIEMSGVYNEIDFKVAKGDRKLEIKAEHYYTETLIVSTSAGNTQPVNVKLKPKMGSLTILADYNTSETEVFINNKKIGEIPIINLTLQEGTYNVSFKKSGYISEKSTYTIDVFENKITNFDKLRMISKLKVRINTSPVNGASVTIDGRILSDKTSLNEYLAIGEHSIKIIREHYKTIEKKIIVDNLHTEFNFELEELSYPVTFITNPTNCVVYVDGQRKGQTYFVKDISLGNHWLSFEKDGFLKKRKRISVTKPLIVAPRLFPSSYYIIGADYGLDQYRFNLGYVTKGILFGVGLQINANSNSIDDSELAIKNVIVDDISTYDEEFGRIYQDSIKLSFNLKFGFTIKKPIVFLLTAGCSFIQTDKFQKVFKAQHDYLAQNNGDIIYKGELFSEPYLTKNAYTAFTAGLMIPIARTIYFSGEYYTNSDIGPGFSFGFGFMLGTNLKDKIRN